MGCSLIECSSPVEKDADKVVLNHYKLRDKKDTWMYNVEQLIFSGRKSPTSYFRLQEIVSLELHVQKTSFQSNLRKLVQVAVAFARMAYAEIKLSNSVLKLEQAQMCKAEIANSVKSAVGGAKKAVGSALGNESMQASGKIQQAEAQASNLAARAEQQAKGVAHDVKGTAQKAVGSVTGNKSMEAEGHINSTRGKAERKI
ncbi:hypothetical protein BGZ68_010025 [Mortierella alpina]|nr:hypothetical protein BGZ68_010025 [Mortierella alpina]